MDGFGQGRVRRVACPPVRGADGAGHRAGRLRGGLGAFMSPASRLVAGLFTLALAGALSPLVLVGLLGLLLFPVGLALAAAGLWGLRAEADADARGPGSELLAWLGLALIVLSAWQGGSLAFTAAVQALRPAGSPAAAGWGAWLGGVGLALAGATLLSLGLRRFPDSAPRWPGGWFGLGAAVFPLAAVLFRVLALVWPFRT